MDIRNQHSHRLGLEELRSDKVVLEEIAADLAFLRGLEIAGADWRIERICERVEQLLTEMEPTAAALIRDGVDPDEALRLVDRRALRIKRLLGTDERTLRILALID